MGRIIGLDYGGKRCGLATTDSLQIIVNSIGTVDTNEIFNYFKTYMENEDVEKIVIGHPKHHDGTDTYLKKDIDIFGSKLNEKDSSIGN